MDETGRLAGLVEQIGSKAVLCIGDVMLDRYVYGTVDRVSPEAPVPVMRRVRESLMPGGAGNVAANITALCGQVRLVGVVGNDGAGEALARLLPDAALVGLSGRATTEKTRFVAGGQQLLRADAEDAGAVTGRDADRLIAAIAGAAEGAGAFILSDYAKGVLSPQVITAVMEIAAARGLPVIVDPAGRDYSIYRGATALTPNRTELSGASGMPAGSDAEIEAAARRLTDRCGIEAVVATRSEQGLSVVRAAGAATHLRAEAREVFDVSGAGDTVAAVLGLLMATGASLEDAGRLANLAGGIVVGKAGTATLTKAEMLDALLRQNRRETTVKIVPADTARDHVARWRDAGLSVGFTNGCFDLLHPGHVSLMRQARAECDRLVVGLNSDASVKRLKGEARPVQNEAARATVLASLADVDLVVIFGEDTPLRLIETLRPDVLVKGADYTVETVVGADLVQGRGGRIVLAGLEAGQSTTSTIERMKPDGRKTG